MIKKIRDLFVEVLLVQLSSSLSKLFFLTILNKFIMWKEFKEFAVKGNLIDIAVGFVMGAAFTRLTGAFVDGMVVPLVSMLTGDKNFDSLKWVLKPAEIGADGKEVAAEVAVMYGGFLTACLDFLIVALVMFMIVKAVNKMKAQPPAGPPPPPPADIVLLEQIRDLLKK
jgi:large conductance mechanosensitive channel